MICIGCYKETPEGYCRNCRKNLFNGKNVPTKLTFDTPKDGNLQDYQEKTKRLSISGVQLKYSLKLIGNELLLTERQGEYLLKPIPPSVEIEKSDQAPENEHLTMQIAKQVFDLPVAKNALIYFSDGSPAYLTKRFDLKADGNKYLQEDMAQLNGKTRQTDGENFKYEGTYEEVGAIIKTHVAAAAPALELFFKQILFNYLFSNGDAHLKNFSLIETDMGDHSLSLAYDLMSTGIHTPNEFPTALELFEGDTNFDFYNQYGMYGQQAFRELAGKLGIIPIRTERILHQLLSSSAAVLAMIENSFLNPETKAQYIKNYKQRLGLMGMTEKMIIIAIDPFSKSIPTDHLVQLHFPRNLIMEGYFTGKSENSIYQFLNQATKKETQIDIAELQQVIPLL